MEEHKLITEQASSKEMEALLNDLKRASEKQVEYARKQSQMSQITATASVLMLTLIICVCGIFVPRVNRMFYDVEIILTQFKSISQDLEEANLGQMTRNLDRLVSSSEKGVQEALEQINSIDINTLNQAISDLSDVISPLAKFFGK